MSHHKNAAMFRPVTVSLRRLLAISKHWQFIAVSDSKKKRKTKMNSPGFQRYLPCISSTANSQELPETSPDPAQHCQHVSCLFALFCKTYSLLCKTEYSPAQQRHWKSNIRWIRSSFKRFSVFVFCFRKFCANSKSFALYYFALLLVHKVSL